MNLNACFHAFRCYLKYVLISQDCGGVTYESDRRGFTLRRGRKFKKTGSGECSWRNPWYPELNKGIHLDIKVVTSVIVNFDKISGVVK